MRLQIGHAEFGGQQFALPHHARAGVVANLAHQSHASGNLFEFAQAPVYTRRQCHTKVRRQLLVALPQTQQGRGGVPVHRLGQQGFEAIGDARNSGMDHYGLFTSREPKPKNMDDLVPVRSRRNASAAKLENNERPDAARGDSRGHERKAPWSKWKLEFVVLEIAELPF